MSTKVTLQFSDNQSGSNADVEVGTGGVSHPLTQVLANTSVGNDGYCSAVQIVKNGSGVTVVIKKDGKQIAECSGSGDNYAQFERTDIGDLAVVCTKA